MEDNMFDLNNILHFAELNIQTIGIFIAIIGGLLVTKLLNLKIEKTELVDKINMLNKEIEYNRERIKIRKERIFKNNREAFIDEIYTHVIEKDFNIDEYESHGLSLEERQQTYNDVMDTYKKAISMFEDREYYYDDIEKVLYENNIYNDNEMYWVYYEVGSKFAKEEQISYGPIVIPNFNSSIYSNKIVSFQENMEERDLTNDYTKIVDINNWKIIEKQEIERKIKAININLKSDLLIFLLITIFGIIIPQVIISIHPLFIDYKFLKYWFAIYSILTFIFSMTAMIIYIYNMYKSLQK